VTAQSTTSPVADTMGTARSARRWRPGVAIGVVAATPSAAAATGSALLAACGSCLGLGSAAAAVSATAATTGGAAAGATSAASGGGLPLWQLGFAAAAVFVVLAAVQLRRALAAARCRPVTGSRAAFVLRQMAPSLPAGAIAFAAVQLVVVPWLSAPPLPAAPTLP
jgi:hypothetical protein